MTSAHHAWIFIAGALAATGCTGPTAIGTGGSGGSSTTSSTTGGAGGAGGASTTTTTTTTTTTSTGTGGGPTYDPSGFSCSGATPSLADDVVKITGPSCATGMGCHAAMNDTKGVMNQFVNRLAQQCTDLRLFIDPGNPERSYVIHKMTNHNICTGQTMPKDVPMLPAAEIQVIYDWICNGALDN